MLPTRPRAILVTFLLALALPALALRAGSPAARGAPLHLPAFTVGATPIPDPDGVTRFAIIGDYGDGSQAEADVAALVHGWDVDFVTTAGDNNYPDGEAATIDENIGRDYARYIYPYSGAFGPGSPDFNRFFPSPGNHDWRSIGCVAADCIGAYFDYFTLPRNERYYDVRWGDVHLFIIDSYPGEPDGITEGSIQATWLRGAAGRSSAAWKLIITHYPPYSSSSVHGNHSDLWWPYDAWGIDVVIAGHDHTYERIERDETLFFVNGLGGKSRYQFGSPETGSRVRYNDDYGAMWVEADAERITFRFYTRAGELVDERVLTK